MGTETVQNFPTKIATWPNLDPGIWSALDIVLWTLLGIGLYFAFRTVIRDLMTALVIRARSGAALKLGPVELGQMRVSAFNVPSGGAITASRDRGEWEKVRDARYESCHNVFVAQRIFVSAIPGQLYDILVYIVPHKDRDGSLREIRRVQYYFGKAWGNQVFETTDRGKRFGIVVSAYGSGFLCTARVFVRGTDGNEEWFDTWRYIDFEMGPLGEGGTGAEEDLPGYHG